MKQLVIIFVMGLILSTIVRADEPTLCEKQEVSVVSCGIKGKQQKIVSICAVIDSKTPDKNFIEYRFGTKKNIQLSYKVTRQTTDQKLYRWVDKVTYTTYFGFNKGEFSYSVGVPEERFGALTFVSVKKNGNDISNLECKTNSFGEKKLNSSLIVDVSDDFLRSNKNLVFPPK